MWRSSSSPQGTGRRGCRGNLWPISEDAPSSSTSGAAPSSATRSYTALQSARRLPSAGFRRQASAAHLTGWSLYSASAISSGPPPRVIPIRDSNFFLTDLWIAAASSGAKNPKSSARPARLYATRSAKSRTVRGLSADSGREGAAPHNKGVFRVFLYSPNSVSIPSSRIFRLMPWGTKSFPSKFMSATKSQRNADFVEAGRPHASNSTSPSRPIAR